MLRRDERRILPARDRRAVHITGTGDLLYGDAGSLAKLAELAGDGVSFEFESDDIALEVPFSGTVVDAMVDALHAEDPEAVVLPYMLSGGTDNKSLDPLGITGYGFVPLRLPDELDFPSMFHGVDERVPTDSLEFGSRVLHRLLTRY